MWAWTITHHGPLERIAESLQRVLRPRPQPGPNEALVRVQAVGLNHMDLWAVQGLPGFQFPLPLVPGLDIAGTLDAFGPLSDEAQHRCEEADLRPRAEVVVYPLTSCGRCAACVHDEGPLCDEAGLLGETRDGGCAEFVVVPVRNLVRRPKGVKAETAAALPTAYVTAWSMLHRRARLQRGEIVLVHAAGSGVSAAAIQLARMAGATVVATAGSAEKLEAARRLGAEHVIDSRAGPFRPDLVTFLKSRGRRGVDVVVDHVGADTLIESVRSLARGGRAVVCGATSGGQVTLDLKLIFYKSLSVLGTTMGARADLEQLLKRAAAGELAPVIDWTYPMENLPIALTRLASRQAFGKIVLNVTSSAGRVGDGH